MRISLMPPSTVKVRPQVIPLKLRLIHVFYVTSVIGIVISFYGIGFISILTSLVFVAASFGLLTRRIDWTVWTIITGITLLFSCVTTGKSSAYADSRGNLCANQLTIISVALKEYHEVHQCYPPAVVQDAQGKPIHSWRVLILPYLGDEAAQQIYDQYDFASAWNSPQNRLLIDKMPVIFRCPDRRKGAPNETDYVAIDGPFAAWNGQASRTQTDFTAETIAIVEIEDSGIKWTEPRDISIMQAVNRLDVQHSDFKLYGHRHSDLFHHRYLGVHAASLTGRVSTIGFGHEADVLESVFFIDSGWDSLRYKLSTKPRVVFRYDQALRFLVLVGLVLIPAYVRLKQPPRTADLTTQIPEEAEHVEVNQTSP
jgi:hypothetical protein